MTVRRLPGPAPCQFCGKVPACPDWTCKRIKSVTVDEVGWSVDFWPDEPAAKEENDEAE